MSPEKVLELLGEAPWYAQLIGLVLSVVLPLLLKRYLPALASSGTKKTEEEVEELAPGEDKDVQDLRTTLRSVLTALTRAQEEIGELSTSLNRKDSEIQSRDRDLAAEREKSRELAARVQQLAEDVARAQRLLESLAAGRAPANLPPPTPPPTPPAYWTQ